MKKIISLFSISFLFALTSCSSNEESSSLLPSNSSSTSESSSSNSENSSSNSQSSGSTSVLTSKALVIYFSATNHTENVAINIAAYTNAPIHKLEPKNPYTSQDLNYSYRHSRVVQEYEMTQNGNIVNVELNTTSFEEFDNATYIFLGAPVWWQQLSWVIENFVEDNDFSNKTIIPFGTSSSSSFNLNNLTSLTNDDTNVTWLSPHRFSSNASLSSVTNWVDSLNLDLR